MKIEKIENNEDEYRFIPENESEIKLLQEWAGRTYIEFSWERSNNDENGILKSMEFRYKKGA